MIHISWQPEWWQSWPVISCLRGFNTSEFKSSLHGESEDLHLMSPVIKDPHHLWTATSGLPASCVQFTFSLEVKNLIIWTSSVIFFCLGKSLVLSVTNYLAKHNPMNSTANPLTASVYSGSRGSLFLSC